MKQTSSEIEHEINVLEGRLRNAEAWFENNGGWNMLKSNKQYKLFLELLDKRDELVEGLRFNQGELF